MLSSAVMFSKYRNTLVCRYFQSGSNTGTQTMLLSNTPVSDRSFLTKKAADMCAGVSVYWAYRHCPTAMDSTKMNSTLGIYIFAYTLRFL